MADTENLDTRPDVSGRSRLLAIISVVLPVVGILLWIASIGLIAVPIIVAGLVMGHLALGQIKRAGGGGRWMPITGLVIGYAGAAYVAYSVVSIVFFFGAWILSGSH